MYRTSKIFKVKSKGGAYKTKGTFYSFARNDGYVIVFTTKKGMYGLPEIGKFWELEGSKAKKFFKMIGFGVEPEKFDKVFEDARFFNHQDRTSETINLFPARMTLARNKAEKEIQKLKDEGSIG